MQATFDVSNGTLRVEAKSLFNSEVGGEKSEII